MTLKTHDFKISCRVEYEPTPDGRLLLRMFVAGRLVETLVTEERFYMETKPERVMETKGSSISLAAQEEDKP